MRKGQLFEEYRVHKTKTVVCGFFFGVFLAQCGRSRNEVMKWKIQRLHQKEMAAAELLKSSTDAVWYKARKVDQDLFH